MSTRDERASNFASRVLNFWFSNKRWASLDHPPAKSTPIEESDGIRWFSVSKEFDEEIRENFENDLSHLLNDDYRYPNDITHPEHLLACIIALDQFPRNMYRGHARAFAYDVKARELSRLLISHQLDKQLPYIERIFINLTFEHSEDLDDQNQSVRYFEDLYIEGKNDPNSNEDTIEFLECFIHTSKKHRDIIERFGRFPHRNAVLQRQSFEREDVYLRDGGERFGQ